MYFLATSFYVALLLSAIVPVCGQTAAGGTGGDTCVRDCSSSAAKQNLEAAKACLASTDENVEVACICNTLALRTALDTCIKTTCPDQLATVDTACDSLTGPSSASGSATPVGTGPTGVTPGGTDSTGTASDPPGGLGGAPPSVSSAPPAAVGTGGDANGSGVGVGTGVPSGNAGGASGNGIGTSGSNAEGSSGGSPSTVGPNILDGAAIRLGGSLVRSLITLAIAVASLL